MAAEIKMLQRLQYQCFFFNTNSKTLQPQVPAELDDVF